MFALVVLLIVLVVAALALSGILGRLYGLRKLRSRLNYHLAAEKENQVLRESLNQYIDFLRTTKRSGKTNQILDTAIASAQFGLPQLEKEAEFHRKEIALIEWEIDNFDVLRWRAAACL